MMQDILEVDFNGKIAVAIRAARSAVGLNQQEFSEMIGVAKTTIARIETLEMKANAEFLLEAVSLFKSFGVEIDMHDYQNIVIKISNQAINTAVYKLQDINKRRTDKKVAL
jgi:transcriptional regulator with XRE-family HTH domain